MSSSRKFQKSLLAVAVSMVIAPAAYAADQNAAANYDRITGDTVVVTAARTQKALLDTDASVSVVTTKETQLLNRDSVPELLANQPGINVISDGTPGAKRVAIRGESSSRTLVMVNGDRISDQKSKSGAPLLTNPYFIDRIEVVKGPASVLYGSDAIGGIVNVITKQASDKPVTVEAGVGYNSAFSSFTEYMNVLGTVDRFHYAIGAFNDNAGDMRIADGYRVDNTAYDARGGNLDLSYDVTDNVTLGYNAELYVSNAEVSTTTDNKTYKHFRGEIPQWDRQKHKIYLKATDLNDVVAAVDAAFYYQTNDKEYNNNPVPFIDIGVVNSQKTFGGNIQAEFTLSDRVNLITGYEGRLDKVKADSTMDIKIPSAGNGGRPSNRAAVQNAPHKAATLGAAPSRPGTGGPNAGGPSIPSSISFVFTDRDYEQQNHAAYALLSSELTDELTLNTGVRYNYVKNIAGSTTMKYTHVPKPMVFTEDDTSDSKLLGSVGIIYRPFDHGAFRANWSQGFRSPSIQELFIVTSSGAMQYGNPDLKAEESDNFELGFRWDDGALAADFSVFYTQADNYIESFKKAPTQTTLAAPNGRPGAGGNPGANGNPSQGGGSHRPEEFTFQNIAQADTYGAELALAYLIDNSFEPYVNLAYLVREYKINGDTTNNTGTPRWSGNAGLRFYGSNFEIDGYAKFADNSKNDDLAKTSYLGAYNLPGYVTWNLAASVHFGPEDRFTAYAALENIFDKDYMTNEIIAEPGRNFSLGVRGQF